MDFGGWLYGLPGILIAHVFFNAPFAARIFLGALAAVPGEHWRLAAQLGMRPAAIFRILDWPVLKREAPMLAALIFLLCFTSFAIVLTLGGGPGAATLEVAIYGRVRFDVDFARAGLLALLQVAICVVLALPIVWLISRPAESAAAGTTAQRPDARSPAIWRLDAPPCSARRAASSFRRCVATAVSGVAALSSLFRLDVLVATATSLPDRRAGGSSLVLALALRRLRPQAACRRPARGARRQCRFRAG